MRGEIDFSVGQDRAEPTHDEEEELDYGEENCSVNEFVKDDAEPSVQYRTMLEQEVAYAIDIPHLHIRASQKVALLVAFRNANGDVGLQARKFICLRCNDTDHVPLFTLDAKLADCRSQISLLVRGHCRADDQSAETAQCEEQLGQSLVLQNELKRRAIDENAVLLVLIEEVNQGILIAHIDRLAAG